MRACVRSVVANVAPVNVSDAKVIEDRACNCSVFGWPVGRKYTNATTEYHEKIAYGPQVLLFPTQKLATSYLFLPRGDCYCWAELQHAEPHRVRRTNATLSNQRIRTAYNAHFAEGAETISGGIVQNCTVHLIECAWTLQAYFTLRNYIHLCLKKRSPFIFWINRRQWTDFSIFGLQNPELISHQKL